MGDTTSKRVPKSQARRSQVASTPIFQPRKTTLKPFFSGPSRPPNAETSSSVQPPVSSKARRSFNSLFSFFSNCTCWSLEKNWAERHWSRKLILISVSPAACSSQAKGSVQGRWHAPLASPLSVAESARTFPAALPISHCNEVGPPKIAVIWLYMLIAILKLFRNELAYVTSSRWNLHCFFPTVSGTRSCHAWSSYKFSNGNVSTKEWWWIMAQNNTIIKMEQDLCSNSPLRSGDQILDINVL